MRWSSAPAGTLCLHRCMCGYIDGQRTIAKRAGVSSMHTYQHAWYHQWLHDNLTVVPNKRRSHAGRNSICLFCLHSKPLNCPRLPSAVHVHKHETTKRYRSPPAGSCRTDARSGSDAVLGCAQGGWLLTVCRVWACTSPQTLTNPGEKPATSRQANLARLTRVLAATDLRK